MIQERIYILLAKILSGEANSSELEEFNALIDSNHDWKSQHLNLDELWHTSPETESTDDLAEESYRRHAIRLAALDAEFGSESFLSDHEEDAVLFTEEEAGPWYLKWSSLTLLFLLLLVPSVYYKFYYQPKNDFSASLSHFNEIKVSRGTKTKLQLPDGTQVWVNADSKLSYPETFKGQTREVFLEGEAYFDVVKDPKHPFIVHTSGINIRVLGTAFNVKAYKAESTIEATLVHGLIEVTKTDHPEESKIILRPHEKLIFDKLVKEESITRSVSGKSDRTDPYDLPSPAITIAPLAKTIADSAIKETSWVYNRLSFDDEKFEDLALKIERWFNVKITINNEKIRTYRTTGSFENETIEEALKELQYLVPFNYQINGREVIINKK